jgi:hypothetical protein
MIFKILGWIALIAANVHIDYWLIEKRKSGINHIVETIVRGMAGILYGAFVFNAQVETGGWVILFEIASFVTIFEPWLNLRRGRAWDYLSSAPDAAAWDRFFVKHQWLYYVVKLVAVVAVGYSIYKLISL